MTRYIINLEDRTGTVKDTFNVDEITEFHKDYLSVWTDGEGAREIDLRMKAKIEIIDRLRMGIL